MNVVKIVAQFICEFMRAYINQNKTGQKPKESRHNAQRRYS